MSTEVKECVRRLLAAGFSPESVSITVSLPVADVVRVARWAAQ